MMRSDGLPLSDAAVMLIFASVAMVLGCKIDVVVVGEKSGVGRVWGPRIKGEA